MKKKAKPATKRKSAKKRKRKKKRTPARDISPNGRFRINDVSGGSSDHFYHPDMDWELIDTKTGEIILEFTGRSGVEDSIHKVEFNEKGEVITKDKKGRIIQRIPLLE